MTDHRLQNSVRQRHSLHPEDIVTLVIDGQQLTADPNDTLLTIAQAHNIHIPTLCFLEGISAYGGCRVCLVEVEGYGKLVPACLTHPAEGIIVRTQSPRVIEYRKKIVELLLSERNHICSVCVTNGHCELQQLASTLGITHIRYPGLFPSLAIDASNTRFIHDPNRCVLCSRCVRVCAEIEGAHTWDIIHRGIKSRVSADLNQPWKEAVTCTGCGKCVQACPTGALSEQGKAVGEMLKKRYTESTT
ncbi:bidirectional hydrogenase complex protein HoxU [Desulfogranum japonicum]|uniref:bidirectional hydrogenase complex protein HoxU n=1 Tax=Desulfogranum japonicum TaxID=231447 RepID=UPI00040090A8|nr:bidirectional hydrogenase complex protein HoxU [Desulfogranum japonicum]